MGADASIPADPPLAGIRVVEAASYVSAPFAAFVLAQLGADVVKVEPPGGDPFRRFGLTYEGVSAFWVNVNQGKRSIALDLKEEEGQRAMQELLGEADVFVQNWRPGVAEKLGLDRATLSERYPRLVHVAVNGYGESGPRAAVPTFDGLLQAASGLAVAETRGDRPTPLRAFVVDKVTAMVVVQSVLAALLARTTTGRGTGIDLAMLDVIGHFDFPDLCQDRTFLPPAPQVDMPASRPGVLETSDGYIAVAPVTGRQLGAAVTAVGHPEWKEDLKAAPTPTAMVDLLYDRLESVTKTKPASIWEKVFEEHDVPAAIVRSIDQHFEDPQTIHNQIYGVGESPLGPVRRVRYPARLDGRQLECDSSWTPTAALQSEPPT